MSRIGPVLQFQISKAMRQLAIPGVSGSPDTQVPLKDSPVVTVQTSCPPSIGTFQESWTVSPDNPIYLDRSFSNYVRGSLLSDSQFCLTLSMTLMVRLVRP